MLVFTHLTMANFFYSRVLKHRNEGTFKMKWAAFLYGNIKPDITKMASMKHHLPNTYEFYEAHRLAAMDSSLTSNQRSVSLGVACHFLCDYFCKYHVKEPYMEASLTEHLIYELKLHLSVIKGIWSGKWTVNHSDWVRPEVFGKPEVNHKLDWAIDATAYEHSMVYGLHESYHITKPSLNLDSIYSMKAVNGLLEEVLGLKGLLSERNRTVVMNMPSYEDLTIAIENKVVASGAI